MVNRNTILLAIFSVAQLLQTTLARPVQPIQSAIQPPAPSSAPTISFTLFNFAAGQYVKMMENGSVMAVGQESDLSTEWQVRMSGNTFQFVNAAYPGHYLLVANYKNTTVLHGHDISKPLTASRLGIKQDKVREGNSTKSEELKGDSIVVASGDGEQEMNVTDSTNAADSSQEEEELPTFLDWHVEYISLVNNRFRILMGEGEDCFLAFDSTGHPVADFCQVTADSYESIMAVGIKGF